MLIYIDETGDHDLLHIDKEYPIFGLGALLISEKEYKIMDKEIKSIKKEFFNDKKGTFILHALELKRPNNKKSDRRNQIMLNSETRTRFYDEFDKRIIKQFSFQVIACFIKKRQMVNTYAYPIDPYHLSFENLLNRIIRYGGKINTIYAEKRYKDLDAQLIAEYNRLASVGIYSFPSSIVVSRTELKLVNKKENISGLQVIDLILACIARHGMGKKNKMAGNDLKVELIKDKYACPITVFPYKR